MIAEEKYVQKISKSYNPRHVIAFVQKRAEQRFLTPLGLTLQHVPSENFSNNCKRLSPNEEFEMFAALHFMKYKIKKAKRAKERYIGIYLALRNRLISANWPLVPSCVEKHIRRFNRADLPHVMESGNFALISCVDYFDPWRGFRFSTYAMRGILQGFIQRPRLSILVVPIDEKIDHLKPVDEAAELWTERLKEVYTHQLTAREREVLDYRFCCFGRNDTKLTLGEVGEIWGLTKERVRQVQLIALTKLKNGLRNDPILNI